MNAKELMLRLGVVLGLELYISDEGVCRIYFDDDAVDFEITSEGICLIAELGILPSQDNTNLYRTLLTANLFGIATAGATLSIDPDSDSIFLHKMLYNGLDYSDFETRVEFFIKVLRHWKRQLLENPSPTEEYNVPFYSLRI